MLARKGVEAQLDYLLLSLLHLEPKNFFKNRKWNGGIKKEMIFFYYISKLDSELVLMCNSYSPCRLAIQPQIFAFVHWTMIKSWWPFHKFKFSALFLDFNRLIIVIYPPVVRQVNYLNRLHYSNHADIMFPSRMFQLLWLHRSGCIVRVGC